MRRLLSPLYITTEALAVFLGGSVPLAPTLIPLLLVPWSLASLLRSTHAMVTTRSILATTVAALLFASGVSGRGVLRPRTYCTNAKQVVEGNTCENIADKRCTISLAQFKSYNPNLDCSNLRVGQNFCCNEGTVPRDADCTNHKTVVEGNTCATIADKRCTISLTKFTSLNPHLDCSNLRVGQAFCCNEGAVPLPDCTNIKAVLEGNTCAIIADKRCTITLSKFQDYNPVSFSMSSPIKCNC
jgi:hypothetical protein